MKDQKFDLIINVEGRSRFGTPVFQDIVKAAESLLKPGGIFVCADYGEMTEMAKMSSLLESSSQLVREKEISMKITFLNNRKC